MYVVSKNAVVAGPANVAYSAAKADQAHQVRLLAAELGRHGIRVNGVNPDGVVEGSGIFSGVVARGNGRRRTAWNPTSSATSTRAVRCSARRCCRGTSPTRSSRSPAATLSRTTGLLVPVDGGVAAAFLR